MSLYSKKILIGGGIIAGVHYIAHQVLPQSQYTVLIITILLLLTYAIVNDKV